MKKISFSLFISLIACLSVVGQNIGINSTGAAPDGSAALDIAASDKGVLVPRVALTASNVASPVTSPLTSLLVYNTATAGTAPNNVVPGFYYWNGSVWAAMGSVAASNGWTLDGNNITSLKSLGTTSNKDLPFITNNTERMRINSSGDVAIGTSTFNGPNPEQLVVNAGTTSSVNAIVGKGSINNYLQLNIQNQSAGTSASSDVVATADNGSETTNYIDMGINSSTYTGGIMGTANDSYLYNMGQNLLIGTGSAAKSLIFTTGGTSQSTNERMRIDGTGNVRIGTAAFDGTNPEKLLIDAGTTSSVNAIYTKGTINKYFQMNIQNLSPGNQSSSDLVATANNGTETTNFVNLGINGSGYVYQNGNPIETGKSNDGYLISSGNDFYVVNNNASKDILFLTGGTAPANERVRILSSGNVGIGNSAPNSTLSVTGSLTMTYHSGSGAHTVLATEYIIINNGAAATWTLPVATGCPGRIYRLVNQGTGNITLSQPVTTANLITTTTLPFGPTGNFEILSDGVVWRKIN